MRIAEISSPSQSNSQSRSPSRSHSHIHDRFLSQIESLIKQIESLSPDKPFPVSVSADLRQSLTQLSQLAPFANDLKLHLWKLSYRLWNSCVDHSNTSSIIRSSKEHAYLRHLAADILSLGPDVVGIPSPAVKSASFYYKTGLIWHNLQSFDLASTCFERASDIVSKVDLCTVSDAAERKMLMDLNIARSRTAWEVSDRTLAVALLNRAKTLLFGLPEHFKELGNQYLAFGKILLSKNESHSLNEALKFLKEALDLYEKGLSVTRAHDESFGLKELKLKTLRFISAVHLQLEEFESVIKCVRVLREGESGDHHPSLTVLAMKAWVGLGRHAEAEKELRGMVVDKGVPESIWVSAVETYFEAAGAAGAETAKGVFLGLLGRCHVSAASAVRIAHRLVGDGIELSKQRAKVAAELVSDEKVVALFNGQKEAKQRKAMHAVLWNCAAGHFRAKNYEASAELFEKSMLYILYDIEDRSFRAKGFRALCLCYLGLSILDRAEEYINEAEKIEPCVACAFIKFKICLQKNDHVGAIHQIPAMTTCLGFTTDFLFLSAHEAVACHAIPVAVASLSNILNFYNSGISISTAEVVVLRTLVAILIKESGDESDILKFIQRAHERASEIGRNCFFGEGEVGRREQKWFAVTSWNFGTRMGKERKYEICAEFLIMASKFYGDMTDGKVDENNIMVCKSLILSVSAILASENETQVAMSSAKIKIAKELLDKAGKILKSIPTENELNENPPLAFGADQLFIYTLSAYDIHGRLKDSASQQILLQNFVSSNVCNHKLLLQVALCVSQGPCFNYEAANFALHKCLSSLLSSPSPDYQEVALVIRKLIIVTSINKGETDDDAVRRLYKNAYKIMVGLKEGEYPTEEGKWLAMTAWNRASIPIRMGRIDLGKKWMDAGLEIAMHVAGMAMYRACMEDFVNEFQNKFSVAKS